MNFGKIQLKLDCIKNIPLFKYSNDFSFIVNDVEFKTSRIIADLLSPTICNLHSIDPTIDKFTINTIEKGDFSQIFSLIEFEEKQFSKKEIPFITEVIEILGNESIEYQEEIEEITIDNVFSFVKMHEKYPKIFSKSFLTEIDFISEHFPDLCEKQENEFRNISIDTLMNILNNKLLQLKTENQLLKFANQMYKYDVNYSIVYESVIFENVSSKAMREFISIYNFNDMNNNIWNKLSKRLEHKIKFENDIQKVNNRYKEKLKKTFPVQINEFKGILSYLYKKSKGEIGREISIESYSMINNCQPTNVVLFDSDSFVETLENENNECNWLRFDFRNYRVIPTDYTIKSYPYNEDAHHPKHWVIEGSNDNKSWEILDKKENCDYLRGKNKVQTFKMNQNITKEFRYIRMRLTRENWYHDNNINHRLAISSFEMYGIII